MAQMTFLDIVKRAYRESGLQNNGPQAVTGQVGRNNDFVNWVLAAHEEIQLREDFWTWDWATISVPLTVDEDTYDPTAAPFGITGGVKHWLRDGCYCYPTANGVNARTILSFLEWERFRFINIPVVPGQQVVFTERPDGKLVYYPRPNVAMTAVHEYYRKPEVLVDPTDVPRMPADLHMAIVWKAVMYYADFNKDWSLLESAEEHYDKLMDPATSRYAPSWTMGGPLA